MLFKGITKRWFLKCAILIVLIVCASECFLICSIKKASQQALKDSFLNKANNFSNVLCEESDTSQEAFNEKCKTYIKYSNNPNLLNVCVYDKYNNVVASKSEITTNDPMQDYLDVKDNKKSYSYSNEKLHNGIKAFSLSKALKDQQGNFQGIVRYTVSLQTFDDLIAKTLIASIIICLLMISFLIISSLFFIKSIIAPICEVSKTSRKIALGNFNAKLNKKHDDEIGELCDTVNYMAQKLSESEKMKNDFISSISHELRTPLTAIKGWAETIQTCPEDKDMYEKGVNVIIHESERLCGLVEELLDFSRMQGGRMILKLDKIDILAEISEAVYMFRKKAVEENKILLYSEPENLPAVLGDRNRLKQVFINVIDNAIKYTPENGVISVGAKEENGYISITISDNGCGIPNIHLPRVTEKFYKANTTQKGSGIGLAVANEIVILHGGFINIKSEENIGTVVTIMIPIAGAVEPDNIIKGETK